GLRIASNPKLRPLGPGSSLTASPGLPDLRILECRSRANPRSVRSLVRDTGPSCPGRVQRTPLREQTRPGTQGPRDHWMSPWFAPTSLRAYVSLRIEITNT